MRIENEIDHVVCRSPHLIKALGDENTMILHVAEIGRRHATNDNARWADLPRFSTQARSANRLALVVSQRAD